MASLSGPKIPRLERYTLNTPWIQSWIQKFEGNQLKDWADEYGMGLTLTLLKVNLNWNAIQGAIPFWDPTYSVFRFKLNELTPTIEEFEFYLQLKDNGGPIRPSLKDGYKAEASKFFDLKRSELKNSSSGHLAFTRISKEFLTEKVQGKKNEKPRVWLDTFTLVVLAHFFFPCRGNTINLALMEIVNQLKAGLRLAPMVLAQMYHALNMCSTGNRKFQACAPLLQMWLFEHIGVVEKDLQLNLPRPADWHSYLALIDENEDLRWEGTFHIAKSPILAFKNRRCLALIGLTHSVVYYPIRVLRQFGQPQGIPIEESLEDLVGPMTKKVAKSARL